MIGERMHRQVVRRQIAVICELTGLEVAKYLLSKLVKYQDSIESMTEALESDDKLVSELLDSFTDIGWIRQKTSGTYMITSKGNHLIHTANRSYSKK
jgi:predicted transcriptional regulator